jgi:hypothetical protein
VGGLLVNELVADSRGLVEKPMSIVFIGGAPKVEPYRLEEPERPKGPVESVKADPDG